ncbi:MAG TPA: pyridoxal phosphate-dependent aminotransferase [Alphaproteobacteria bacterium]|nr:pyridoxal phosphate-dependent aminotransferase [Alphaproteobacteria bacterium]
MRTFEAKNRYFDTLFNTEGLYWLGQNTNHMPMHPAVRQAILDTVAREDFHAYAPPAGFEELRALILRDLGLEGASVYLTDGAVEGLYLVCRNLCRPGDAFVTTDPGWKWPMSFSRASGATVVEIPIYDPGTDYKLTPAQLEAAITPKTRVVYLVDPNNPLGIRYTSKEIEAFARIAKAAGAYLIHDCTYRHFADGHTLAYPFYPEGTIVTYSFSKWLGLAGLRVGAIVAHPDLLESLVETAPNMLGGSVLAQRAAIAGLKIKDAWFPEVQAIQRRNQAKIKKAVDSLPGLAMPVYPSHGNFVVVDCAESGLAPEAICDVFRERGIMIRQGAYHSKVAGHRFIKVSTTVPEAWIDAFCRALPEVVEAARGRNELAVQF